jgi:biopolymer transport protein ExbD
VELPPEPNPNEDLINLRPNPLTLIAAIAPDLKVTLNADPIGFVNDLNPLQQRLQEIFKMRTEQHAYREGYETRVDVPESERIEKTITINAPKSVKYGDVVNVIDAVKGAGANPIVLQLDEMRVFTIQERNY